MFTTLTDTTKTTPYAALLLRLTLGTALVAHGLLKVLVFTVPGTVAFFDSIGYPGVLAYLVIAAELGGGAALIAGIYVRPIALALVPILIGATLQHAGNGWLFTNEGGGYEFPLFWTATLVVQVLLGAGAYAVRLPAALDLKPAGA